MLISGEPGIGKTTLSQAFAAVCRTRHARVACGHALECEGGRLYAPWTQGIGRLANGQATRNVKALLGPPAEHFNLVIPELRGRPVPAAGPSLIGDESARFRLAEAVRSFLVRMAHQKPTVLILEDLHWADAGSLFLLEFIAQGIAEHRFLIVATCRDSEAEGSLSRTLGELARLGMRRIALKGLGLADTGRLMTHVSGRRVPCQVVQKVHARTDGNPFFVTEIARLGSCDPSAIPDNLQMAISARLNRLSGRANRMLVAAAVIGREFDFPLLRATLADEGEDDLLQAVDDALRSFLIEALPRPGEAWYQFTHQLISLQLAHQPGPLFALGPGCGLDEEAAERVIDRLQEIVLPFVGQRRPKQREVELAADDRSCHEHPIRATRQPIQPRRDRHLEVVGNRRRITGAQSRNLGHEERIAVGSCMNLLDNLAWHTPAGYMGHQPPCVGQTQTLQGDPPHAQARQFPQCPRQRPLRLTIATGGHDQEAMFCDALRNELEKKQRTRIGPVQVFQDEDRGFLMGHPNQETADRLGQSETS